LNPVFHLCWRKVLCSMNLGVSVVVPAYNGTNLST
jgi:hypothetical protein